MGVQEWETHKLEQQHPLKVTSCLPDLVSPLHTGWPTAGLPRGRLKALDISGNPGCDDAVVEALEAGKGSSLPWVSLMHALLCVLWHAAMQAPATDWLCTRGFIASEVEVPLLPVPCAAGLLSSLEFLNGCRWKPSSRLIGTLGTHASSLDSQHVPWDD